jgi:hypothetical protein
MNDVQIWLWIFGTIVVGVTSWLTIITRVTHQNTIGIARLETILVIISKKAADILHHPDDRFGIDELLEIYRDREHELSPEQWLALYKRTEQICDDPRLESWQRLAAALVCNPMLLHQLVKDHKAMAGLNKEFAKHKLKGLLHWAKKDEE